METIIRITFESAREVTERRDDSRSFVFPFTRVPADRIDKPDQTNHTSKHRLIVTVANNRLPAWGLNDDDLIKVLFEIGRQSIVESLSTDQFENEYVVDVDTFTHSSTRPYDPMRVQNPDGAFLDLAVRRRIGF